jgi:hypothetical protein
MDLKDVKAVLAYMQWQEKFNGEKPYDISSAGYEGKGPRTNVIHVQNSEAEVINDVRGRESHFQLDRHGFAFRVLEGEETAFDRFYDKDAVEKIFIPQVVIPFLKRHVEGADRVFVFDWHVRMDEM